MVPPTPVSHCDKVEQTEVQRWGLHKLLDKQTGDGVENDRRFVVTDVCVSHSEKEPDRNPKGTFSHTQRVCTHTAPIGTHKQTNKQTHTHTQLSLSRSLSIFLRLGVFNDEQSLSDSVSRC